MSRLIRPCPKCPGYYYEGEACRCCEAIAQARREAAEEMRERCYTLAAIHCSDYSGEADIIAAAIRALEVTP